MSLRLKTFLITSITLAALLFALTLSLRTILLESYQQIELQDAAQDLDRVQNALMNTLARMDQSTQDYAYWNDMYNFMLGSNPDFVETNLPESTFSNNKWNIIGLINLQGVWTFQGGYDYENSRAMDFPKAWEELIMDHLGSLTSIDPQLSIKGLLQVPEGVIFLTCRAILQSNLEGAPQGIMVTGRLLSETQNQHLANQTRLNLKWKFFKDQPFPAPFQDVPARLMANHDRMVLPINEEQLLAGELLHDLNGKPALYLLLTLPRTVYSQGQKSFYYLVSAVILCASVFFVMIGWLLEKLVISRMSRLTKEVAALGSSHDLSLRVTRTGTDEIGQLSDSINGLLKSHENLHVLLGVEKAKSEKLLQNILPEAIADRLKEDSGVIAESYAEVTILFADIVDFTTMSTQISPESLVNLLNDVFSAFDRLAEKHGLEKIKTIGDAYMVVGGVPKPRADHAAAMARMALDMLKVLQEISMTRGKTLQVRIGINTGPVVAGVIGTKKFLYDLWGDTVNTASRMESSGSPGQIQITEATYKCLIDNFELQLRGEQTIKGKGQMTTYLLMDEKKESQAA